MVYISDNIMFTLQIYFTNETRKRPIYKGWAGVQSEEKYVRYIWGLVEKVAKKSTKAFKYLAF